MSQVQTTTDVLSDVKKNVSEFVGKTHPIALIAWFLVGAVLLGAVIFTAWHNWSLYARGADTDVGKALSIVPALLLDGSIVLLLLLLLTYFKDSLQWWIAIGFNVVLFVIVGVNTSLDYSMNRGEQVGPGLSFYLRYGVLGSFLFTFAVWEVLIHTDPKHRTRMRRAKLEASAQEKVDDIELRLIALDVERRTKDLEYQESFLRRKHAARMQALARVEVEHAWGEYEDAEALSEAETIRRTRPKMNGYQQKRPS